MSKKHTVPVVGILCASCAALLTCVAVLVTSIAYAIVVMNRSWAWNHYDRS